MIDKVLKSYGTSSVRPLRLLLVIMCMGCSEVHLPQSNWPPAVSTERDILELDRDTRAVRCIGTAESEIALLARRLPHLTYLYLNTDSAITDKAIDDIITLKHLHQLVLMNASGITEKGLASLAELPRLRELTLEHCPQFTESSLDLLQHMHRLSSLNLRGCPQFNSQSVDRLIQSLPGCKVYLEDKPAS